MFVKEEDKIGNSPSKRKPNYAVNGDNRNTVFT